MRYIAVDTETALIADRPALARAAGVINTGPFVPPALAVVSWAEGGEAGVLGISDGLNSIIEWLEDKDTHLIFHNAAFDVAVLATADEGCRLALLDGLDEGRIHDTMILNDLILLARGEFDLPKYDPTTKTWAAAPLRGRSRPGRSLESVAAAWCGITLSKDPVLRLGFGAYIGRPVSDLPPAAADYAKQDAVATFRIFNAMKAAIDCAGWDNMLSEATQVRASVLCGLMDTRGLAIDRVLAGQLRDRFAADLAPLQRKLVELGFGQWKPKPHTRGKQSVILGVSAGAERISDSEWNLSPSGKIARTRVKKTGVIVEEVAEPIFCLDQCNLRRHVAEAVPSMPRTLTGLVSLDDELLRDLAPVGDLALQVYLDYMKLRKVLGTYLDVYSQVDQVFPRWWSLGARSGRMSASNPSVQNVPKHRYGIRALFVPRPGYVFVKGDYVSQELITLAEVMLGMGIDGPLAAAVRAGGNIHRAVAAQMLRKPEAEVTEAERQNAKVLDFGVPGGLGARKLARYARGQWGLDWTDGQAQVARATFLAAYPDIARYLDSLKVSQDSALRHVTGRGVKSWREELKVGGWRVIDALLASPNPEIRKLGELADRCLEVVLPTGRRRRHCRFTEAANTYFQGLASDVTKEAAWRAERAGLRVVLMAHDEVVCEVPADLPGSIEIMEDAMLGAFASVCPRLGQYARVEVETCTRWGPSTDSQGKEI